MSDSTPQKSRPKLPHSALQGLTTSILEDCLFNIIHTEVLSAHRAEKLLRMSSAAVIAENAAIAKTSSDNFSLPGSNNKNVTAANPTTVRAETAGAVYDHGRITLKGNPLKTTPEVLCGKCRLPRLRYPISGEGSRVPDLSKQYCTRHPFVLKSGHDIYGNPFPIDQPKTKKEREMLKKAEREAQAGRDGTPGSQDNGSGTPSAMDGLKSLAPGGKSASYIPWHTCPSCKRSLLITRFAQHLEKCLGIAGRQSSRNAMAKMSANGAGTPSINGSRVGTPAPGSQDAGSNAGDSITEPGGKKKKKSSYIKKADRERLAAQGLMPAPGKKEKGSSGLKNGVSSTNGDDEASPVKRDRDREADEEKPRKKLKLSLSRKDSEVSISHASADADGDEDDIDDDASYRKGSVAESVDVDAG